MQRSFDESKTHDADDMMARAAWLHFAGRLTQSAVAKRLQIPITRAHRYIARAQNEGLVRVFVDVKAGSCVRIETEILETYGLDMCWVSMDVPEYDTLPLRSLSAKGADFLMRLVSGVDHRVVGIGHGRTLAASVDAMSRVSGDNLKFVSVLGGLTRSYATNPYDVIHRLNQKTGAKAYLMPLPMYANSARDKEVLLAQSCLEATTRLAEQATLYIIGIGEVSKTEDNHSTALDVFVGSKNAKALYNSGARAEVLGQFLDAEGKVLETDWHDRVMSTPLENLRGREVVAIAGGKSKTAAILATLRSGLLTGLIIDEATARAVVGATEPATVP